MILAARITIPIAALFLATGAAHAGFPHYYQCGEFSYYEQAFTGTPGQLKSPARFRRRDQSYSE
jgi:hypothetical protein